MNLTIPERIRLLKMDGEKLQSYLKSNSDIDDDMKDKIYEDNIKYEKALYECEKYGYDFEFENYRFKNLVIDEIIKEVEVEYKEAVETVEGSVMNYMLHINPAFVGHYSPECWANDIIEEGKLKMK